MHRIVIIAAISAILGSFAFAQETTQGRSHSSTGPPEITVGGEVATPLVLTIAELRKLPRKTLRVEDTRFQKVEVYEGVLVEDLLRKAGVPQGDKLRGKTMAEYLLVQAADNYRVVFTLAELNSSFMDSDIIVADTMNGAPLSPAEGPFKLIVPHDKRPARWTKMVKSLTLLKAPE